MKWSLILSMVGLDVAFFLAIYGSMHLIRLFSSKLEGRRILTALEQEPQEDVSQVLAAIVARLYQRGSRFSPRPADTRRSVRPQPASGWLPPLVVQRATSWERMRIDDFTRREPLKSMRQYRRTNSV